MFTSLFFRKATVPSEVQPIAPPIAPTSNHKSMNSPHIEKANDIIERYTRGEIDLEQYVKEVRDYTGVTLYVPTVEERLKGITLYEISKRAIVDKKHPYQRNKIKK